MMQPWYLGLLKLKKLFYHPNLKVLLRAFIKTLISYIEGYNRATTVKEWMSEAKILNTQSLINKRYDRTILKSLILILV
jgi:hypothetical protein